MKPSVFEYAVPATIAGALETLDRAGGATVLAGGQSLVPALNFRLGAPDLIVDVNRVENLGGIEFTDGAVRIGALTRQCEVIESPLVARHCPVLATAATHIGHVPIRNRGTVGGSVAHADPAAELPAVIAALGGTVEVSSVAQVREIPIEEFVLGPYFTVREPNELVTAISVPALTTNAWGFAEISRGAGDFALAGAVAILEIDSGAVRAARVALFGVEPATRRLTEVESMLAGVPSDDAVAVAEAATAGADLAVVDDPQVEPDYRRHLAAVAVARAVGMAASRERSS